MKLVGWEQIENFCGMASHRPSRKHVLDLVALGLLEKKINGRGRVVIDSGALEAAQKVFEGSIAEASARGIYCRSRLSLARVGLLTAASSALNARPARRARKAAALQDLERQRALPFGGGLGGGGLEGAA